MGKRTQLHPEHVRAGARMVDFAGWDMPVQYSSQIGEHRAVRAHAGMFDVSHMAVVDVEGSDVTDFLRGLLANDVARLKEDGRALYTCMLREDGGVLDDLIVYRVTGERYRTVVNAATTDKDLGWIGEQADRHDVAVRHREDLSLVAVQGPEARALAASCLPEVLRQPARGLRPFSAVEHEDWFVSRTGYTGEDGFEIMLPNDAAQGLWRALEDSGVTPCGLGARDTLRLEAGLNLYGQDMDETTTPLDSGLAWTVAWEPESRRFIGRDALERQRAEGVADKLVGLVLEGRGVMRPHQRVHDGAHGGEITSGSYAPTVGGSVALARVPVDCGDRLQVEIRGRELPARVVKPPFVRNGEVRV